MKKLILLAFGMCLFVGGTVTADTMTSNAGISFFGEAKPVENLACTIENDVVAVKDASSVRVRFTNAEGDWICLVDSQLDLKPYGVLDSVAIEVVP